MDDFEKELKTSFLEEAAQLVADVENCFLSLEQDIGDTSNLDKIFRLAHNLKGSSKAVGFDDLGMFTHTFESFILKIKNGHLTPTAAVVSILLKSNDQIRTMIEGYKADLGARFDCSALTSEMENYSEQPAAQRGPDPVESAPVQPQAPEASHESSAAAPAVAATPTLTLVPGGASGGASDAPKPQEGQAAAHSAEDVPGVTTDFVNDIKIVAEKKVQAMQKMSGQESTIRVSLNKVEKLIDFIGEMVILQNVLKEQSVSLQAAHTGNNKTIDELGKVGKEIQDLAMSLRMVPIKTTFQKMQRIVRDTSLALQKDVTLQLEGEETELDKTVLERIGDPLVHLVRNSVDHGIENPDVRVSRGKTENGTVLLKAYHAAGRLIIEVSDDGGGMDDKIIRKKAIEKGLIKPDLELSRKDALQLIFLAGFSTKEQVTEISGRGVGMDVVRTNIQELGGEISIDSEIGKGSLFRISLPLTLAIIEGMILTYDKHRFVLPLVHIHETLQPKPEMIQHSTASGDILLLRGENLPFIRLGDLLGVKSEKKVADMTAIVVRSVRNPFVMMVDNIVGQQQVVVKQLTTELSGIKGVSGTTILGDGRPTLILEPGDLIKRKIFRSNIQEVKAS
jgi:two-component system chemotaxis sensor kinase CheA